jgi:hypothetical protein
VNFDGENAHQKSGTLNRVRGEPAIVGYEFIERLSVSGELDTWRAKDSRGADVVVKRFAQRDVVGFTSRTGSLARLDCPFVAPLRDRGKAGERLFSVRDHLPESLRDVAASLDTATKLRACAEIARALEHAHLHGLVHGAVKPENVLFADGRSPMLVDFSVAAASASEFSRGESLTDARSDQWSLAAVVGFLLVGHVPSPGETLSSDTALDRALQRSLAPSISERFRRIDELARALEVAAGSATDEAMDVRIEHNQNALRVHVAGTWTAGTIEACLRDIDRAMSRFPDVSAIGYVLDAIGGNHSQAIDALGALHRRLRARVQRVAFVSHSPQTRGACILIGTRGGLEWKTFASTETMDTWLQGAVA